MKKGGNRLLKNTVMLYIVTFSSYFFNFITVPYQTRILGPVIYGRLGFAQSLAVYFQMVLDFGFLLFGTAEVSRSRNDKYELSKIMSAVILCKLVLSGLCFTVAAGLCLMVPGFYEDRLLYILCILSAVINSFLPDYLYRGLEHMSVITYRTVGVRLFFMISIFLFLKSREQYHLIPLFNLTGGICSCIWVYHDVYRRLGIRVIRIHREYWFRTMKAAGIFFLSRIATTVYGATNTLILGFIYSGTNALGYYSSAEKLLTAARSAFSPISDSLYPYMVVNRDFKLVKKVLVFFMPIVISGCVLTGIFAEPFCAFLLGEEFRASGALLRLLLPAVVIALPTYLCGFPILTPLGLEKYANGSVMAGAGFHLIQTAALFLTGNLTAEAVCIATVLTEYLVCLIRIYAIIVKRERKTPAK